MNLEMFMRMFFLVVLLSIGFDLNAEDRVHEGVSREREADASPSLICHPIGDLEIELEVTKSGSKYIVKLKNISGERPKLIKAFRATKTQEGTNTMYLGRNIHLVVGPSFSIRPGHKAYSGEFNAVANGKTYSGEIRCGDF